MNEPLSNVDAKKLAKAIVLDGGAVAYSSHALGEMEKRNVSKMDARNTIRGGWVEFSELENDSWRYWFTTGRILVVVAFRSETELLVVTAWRTEQ